LLPYPLSYLQGLAGFTGEESVSSIAGGKCFVCLSHTPVMPPPPYTPLPPYFAFCHPFFFFSKKHSQLIIRVTHCAPLPSPPPYTRLPPSLWFYRPFFSSLTAATGRYVACIYRCCHFTRCLPQLTFCH
jgi:hypothetical protein